MSSSHRLSCLCLCPFRAHQERETRAHGLLLVWIARAYSHLESQSQCKHSTKKDMELGTAFAFCVPCRAACFAMVHRAEEVSGGVIQTQYRRLGSFSSNLTSSSSHRVAQRHGRAGLRRHAICRESGCARPGAGKKRPSECHPSKTLQFPLLYSCAPPSQNSLIHRANKPATLL